MFTGIVEACVPVRRWETRGSGARLTLPAPGSGWAVRPGDSVSVCGVCLTVCALAAPGEEAALPEGSPGADMLFDLSLETLQRTWFGGIAPGRAVNLERAVQIGERLSGHLVQGHVDGVGRVAGIRDVGDGGRLFTFEVPASLERYLIEKGSISLDGISLTVVEPRGRSFDVAIIPETLARTNLGSAEVGQAVNVEADMVGKWIEKLLPGAR